MTGSGPKANVFAAQLLWVLSCCSSVDANSSQPAQADRVEVAVLVLEKEQVTLQVELPGRVRAYRTAEVRPQVTGIIKERKFREGSTVNEGEVLYAIEPLAYRAAYNKASAELASAEANILAARVRAERHSELIKIRAVSKQAADDARAEYQQAIAAVAQSRAALEETKIRLDFTQVVAPISGRIGRSSMTQGALVTAGQETALATIQQLDPIYVDITQSSAELLRLKRKLGSGALPPSMSVRLRLEDQSWYEESGEVQFTEVSVDESTGSVTLTALFPNTKEFLLPGMYVRAVVSEAMQPDAIMVPQQAISRTVDGRATAWVVDINDQVELRTVTTGSAIGTRWLVREGLSAGERVIIEGTDKVKPGELVKPVTVEVIAKSAELSE